MPKRAPAESSAPPDNIADIIRRVERISRENEQLLRRLVEGERRYRGLAKAVWEVQEQERRRLARELHDGIGQLLTALKTQLLRLHQQAAADGLQEALHYAVSLTDNALHDTRELSRLLRPPVLDDLGLAAALSWLGRTIRERTALTVDVRTDIPARLDASLETLVFRAVQEALTNVVKHAATKQASVRAEAREARLHVVVRDAGKGFNSDSIRTADGLGLRGIQDRVELFGGTLHVESRPGAGTTITLELPLDNPPEARRA